MKYGLHFDSSLKEKEIGGMWWKVSEEHHNEICSAREKVCSEPQISFKERGVIQEKLNLVYKV